jgi:hypothetical protein
VTVQSAKIALPNALLIIMDPSGGTIPRSMEGATIASTNSCIAVGCLSDVEGETEVTLGNLHEVDPGDRPIFQQKLSTPSHKLVLLSTFNKPILETSTPQQVTMVRIWANHTTQPDKVIIGIQ